MNKVLSSTQLIKKYGLQAKKSLGQNFILDQNFTDKIVRLAGDLTDCYVLEIGAGVGTLTRSILSTNVKKLIVIEKDQRCIEALLEIKNHYQDRLEIISGDALEINEEQIFKEIINDQKKFKIIANLPYNIGTVLLIKWLKIYQHISSMHLMLQKEVAMRITAKITDNHYGRLAVMTNFFCDSKIAFLVNKNVFVPQPKVTSAIVEIIPRKIVDDKVEFNKLEKVVASAFNQRRKMIRSSLKNVFGDKLLKVLNECQISEQNRAEQLTINNFAELSKRIG